MGKIFLYGAAGTGKTVIRHHVSRQLDYPLVKAEDIKDFASEAALNHSEPEQVILLSAREAWRRFGRLTEANVIKGLKSMRSAIRPVLDSQLASYDDVVVEGIFLDPAYCTQGRMYLLVISDQTKHEAAYFKYRPRTSDTELGFLISRVIQRHLIREAKQYPVTLIEVTDPPEAVVPLLV